MGGPPDSPQPYNPFDMRQYIGYILSAGQGLGVVVLILWVWMLNGDVKDLRTQIAECNREKLEILRTQNSALQSSLLDIRNFMYRQEK